MKIKKLSLITALLALTLVVSPNLFAAGTKEIKSTETFAMIQNISVDGNYYSFEVLTDNEEVVVTINKKNVDTIYNIDSYAVGDYVSFDNLSIEENQAVSTNIKYITPYVTSGALYFVPIEPEFEVPEVDYGFDNVLEHSFNYTYGYSLMTSFNSQGLFINADYLARGVIDIVSIDEEDFFTMEELQSFVAQYQERYSNTEIPKKTENGAESTLEDVLALEKPEILDNQFAYAYGYLIGAQFLTSGIPVDSMYFPQGVLDAAYGAEIKLTQYQMDSAMRDFEAQYNAEQEAALNKIKEDNLNEANSFLEVNATQDGVVTLDSGVQYRILTKGDKTTFPLAEDEVTINYELTLLDGSVMDSSFERGNEATFALTQVISGFSEAVMQMNEGDSIIAWIPPALGYGEEGNQNIEPNSLLIFRIDLISINK
ncbi:MAG: FKBP-type peptidyl-prolyl cis-trans isomerase N-terminal domain-containing protein [Pleomorphochaeta sp.]